jgi:diguanylate cyclase (GGDEF)-like protein
MLRSSAGSSVLINANEQHDPAPLGTVVIDVAHGRSGCARALDQGAPLLVTDALSDPELDRASVEQFGDASLLFVPLGADGVFEGVAVVHFFRRRRRIDGYAQRAAEVLAAQAGHVLRRVRETQALQDLATTDALTGLPNRRVFFTRLADLRQGDAIVFLDLDHFKALNDHEGHQRGDEVLRSFGAALRQSLREGDMCARYGGEEFALVLPDTEERGAIDLLARLRSRWEVERPGLTFSAGVARHASGPPTATLGAADGALFEAKAAGRNAVRVAQAPASVTPLRQHRHRA